jgi:hypothetical protein
METYNISRELKVLGFRVKTFPLGIGEAFEELMKKLPPGDNRSYYGISYCVGKEVFYNATAEETIEGEGAKYGYETFTIEKGEYITEAIDNWQQKTHSIKDVFAGMMKDERIDHSKPVICVEWYKNMNEMLCMIKIEKKKVKQSL